jgi:hypothetical protein
VAAGTGWATLDRPPLFQARHPAPDLALDRAERQPGQVRDLPVAQVVEERQLQHPPLLGR